ncbi:carbon-nitrogen hydrolase [Dactylonectria macrodidyma]|uniref:Carbon-nitrogen hydrolase n=1 Tax=Dactylonectria macrodidyma TaxID=307937 RepID=A0A9P9FTL3_9HYPO|nr:carbon-nitrogen hydrolase [Dactylonectria macrodidyma]
MRIACLQFAPQVGDVDNNLNRADSVLSKANPDDIDLLVLPELAFSGYNFKSLQDIAPFLEPSGSGITSLWARTIALKYNCIVTVGYPEKVDVSPKWPTGPEYYNSAIVVNGDGETIANYRKNFLYYTDETWALEGDRGFYDGFIPGLGNTSIGICMDINPYKFEAPWHAFEFAFHILEVESNLVIVSMAWMTREEPRDFTRMPNEPDMETLTYWVTRLEPLIRSGNQDEIIVVFCNRCGSEDDALYAGTSAVFGIHDGEVNVYGLLGRGEKELLVVDTNNPPYAKLVYRPDADGPGMEAPGTLQKESDSSISDSKNQSPDKPGDDAKPDETKPTTSGNEEKQQLADANSKQNLVPSTPPTMPLPALPKEPNTDSPKRRHPPAITIPKEPDLVTTNSARSPGTESLNIPTPSAPSPTPMAVRPRLIIPESPPILPHQYPPDHPVSAASLRSEKSIQSVKSYTSSGSTQTIRSNPRPPEESTPYPNTATPLSGYPSNFFTSDKRIYGGEVTIETGQGGFDPDTPFDDMSPVSPRWYWRPGDSRMQTPTSATPGTPMWRRPEPFPWPAITATPRPPSRTNAKPRTNDNVGQDLRKVNSKSPRPNDSSNQTNTKKTTQSESSGKSKGTPQGWMTDPIQFLRIPNPARQFRNVLRTFLGEQSPRTRYVGK